MLLTGGAWFLLETVRGTLAARPLWILAILCCLHLGIRRSASPSSRVSVHLLALQFALAYYAVLMVWYLCVPQQVDPAEPTMTSVAWLFRLGQPVYHSVDDANRYSHIYGPLAFILPGLMLRAFGPGMVAAKALGILAAIAAQLATASSLLTRTRSRVSVTYLSGLCVLELLAFRHESFWSRPEPLQLAFVASGLVAASRLTRWPAIVLTGVCLGALSDLKFTGPLYALPILLLLYSRTDLAAALSSVVVGGALASLPFIVFPNVSWVNYVEWIQLSAGNGLHVALLKENVEWAIFLLVPILVRLSSRAPMPPERALFTFGLVIAMSAVAISASKPGAGPYHLMPFIPLIAFSSSDLFSDKGRWIGQRWFPPYVATLVVIVIVQQGYFLRLATDPRVAGSYRDVGEFLTRHAGERVAVGYTSDERMTFARTLAVFRTGDYLLDAPAVQEYQLSGVPLPSATISAMRRCEPSSTWLLPKGGEPFHIGNDYETTGHAGLFPTAFVEAFRQSYVRDGETAFYEVWRCRFPVRGPGAL